MDFNLIVSDPKVAQLGEKVVAGERITSAEAEWLYLRGDLFFLNHLASVVKTRLHGNKVFYNKNFHIEPTNICRFGCKFCSYRKAESDPQAWNLSLEDVREQVRRHYRPGVTEVHLVGGVHPSYDFEYYLSIIRTVRAELPPTVAIKAFSAVEHIAVMQRAGVDFDSGVRALLDNGADTITGGGAEIFDPAVRGLICPDKATSEQWLDFHEACHRNGMKTNATMLYGHVETIAQRIGHLDCLRTLQDSTSGFESFIPLKYRAKNNSMSSLGECSVIDDLKTLAVSRIFLDNVPHIKAYWPMYGKQVTQLALLAGADDVDGTLSDTTKIYSMAGVDESALDEESLKKIIIGVGCLPVERDTFYREIASR